MKPSLFATLALMLGLLYWHQPNASKLATLSPEEEVPVQVTICDLKNDPAKFNHKLLKISGFVSHGFEDFGMFDPACESRQGIWLEYGGTKASNTMYCCGVVPGHTRPETVKVEGITIPLIDNDRFRELDGMIKNRYDLIMHATLVGRFFSGEKVNYPGGEFWSGYGHMGCCMLLVIQQVLSVDSHKRSDLDYGASADQPNINKVGCGYQILSRDWRFTEAIDLQRRAESGDRAWAFDDPLKVARDLLSRESKIAEASIVGLKQVRQGQGRVVYSWRPNKAKFSYMVVVSRPYTMSFYAQNPEKVSWIPIAAYKVGCGDDNSVTVVK